MIPCLERGSFEAKAIVDSVVPDDFFPARTLLFMPMCQDVILNDLTNLL